MLGLLATAVLSIQSPAADYCGQSDLQLARQIARYGEHAGKLHGMPGDPPGDTPCVHALNELRARLQRGHVLDLETWKTILLERGYLQWRSPWPRTETFAIRLHLPALYQGLAIELDPRTLAWKKAKAVHWEMMCAYGSNDGEEDYQELGILFATDRELVFDVTVTTPIWGAETRDGKTQHRVDRLGSLSLEVTPVATLEEAIPPVVDAELTKRIGWAMRLESNRTSGGLVYRSIEIDGRDFPKDLWIDLAVELVHAGKTVERAALGCGSFSRRSMQELAALPGAVFRDRAEANGWTVRVRSSSAAVLHDWNARTRWVGEFELPVADLLDP